MKNITHNDECGDCSVFYTVSCRPGLHKVFSLLYCVVYIIVDYIAFFIISTVSKSHGLTVFQI